jgi:hypothetical protein
MELKDFISETLKQIIEGVKSAQEFANTENAVIVPKSIQNTVMEQGMFRNYEGTRFGQWIAFEIEVSTNEDLQKKGGAGIFVGSVAVGGQASTGKSKGGSSKISFKIPVYLPQQ